MRVLDIANASRVSDVGLRCVGKAAYAMVELNLSGCTGIGGVGLACFGDNSPNIIKLNLAGCKDVPGWAFQVRNVHSPSFLVRELRGQEFKNCGAEPEAPASCDKSRTTNVLVYGSTGPERRASLSDRESTENKTLETLCPLPRTVLCRCSGQRLVCGCNLLEWVDVSGCDKLTDHDVSTMATNCTRIKTLNVRDAANLTDTALVEV